MPWVGETPALPSRGAIPRVAGPGPAAAPPKNTKPGPKASREEQRPALPCRAPLLRLSWCNLSSLGERRDERLAHVCSLAFSPGSGVQQIIYSRAWPRAFMPREARSQQGAQHPGAQQSLGPTPLSPPGGSRPYQACLQLGSSPPGLASRWAEGSWAGLCLGHLHNPLLPRL